MGPGRFGIQGGVGLTGSPVAAGRRILAALVLIFAAAHACASSSPAWQPIGPFGGLAWTLAWSPHDPSLVVATNKFAVYVSYDAGATWTERKLFAVEGNGTHTTSNVIFDPVSPDRIYVIDYDGSVHRSADSGHTWALVRQQYGEVTAFAIDPADTDHLFLYLTQIGPFGEYFSYRLESFDGGASWPSSSGIRNCQEASGVRAVAFTLESMPRRLELVAEGDFCSGTQADPGVYAFGAGGGTRISSVGTAATAELRPTVRLVVDSDAWYMQLATAVMRSVDAGLSWTTIRTATYDSSLSDERLVVGTQAGVLQSLDDGATWTAAAATAPGFGAVAPVSTIAADASGRLLASTRFGVVRSSDGGASWTLSLEGLMGLGIRAVEVGDDGTVWAGQGEPGYTGVSMGLWRSAGVGAPWQLSDFSSVGAYVRDIQLDRATSGRPGGARVLASGSNCLNQNCTLHGPAGPNSGIYVSDDGGLTWAVSGNGIPQAAGMDIVRALALDPASALPTGSSRIFAGTAAYVGDWLVPRSIDGGGTWIGSAGLPSAQSNVHGLVTDLAVATAAAGRVYVATIADNPFGAFPNSFASGVFRSDDAGASWIHASAGLPQLPGWPNARQQTYSVVADRLHAERVWAAGATSGTGGRLAPWVYRSSDGGMSWQSCGHGLPAEGSVRRIAQSDQNGNVLVVAIASTSYGSGRVLLSRDACASWVELPNPAARSATEILIRGSRVFAGTPRGIYVTMVDDADMLADGFE